MASHAEFYGYSGLAAQDSGAGRLDLGILHRWAQDPTMPAPPVWLRREAVGTGDTDFSFLESGLYVVTASLTIGLTLAAGTGIRGFQLSHRVWYGARGSGGIT